MNELQRRLQEAVKRRYGGSYRDASLACGKNPNLIWDIMRMEHRVPRLETLLTLAQHFDWRIADVVEWVVGYREPERTATALEMLEKALVAAGLQPEHITLVMSMVASLRPPVGQDDADDCPAAPPPRAARRARTDFPRAIASSTS